jgi:hypothetical protein
MRISGNGNVGIGTTAPQAIVDITTNAASEQALFIQNQNAGGYAAIRVGASDRATNNDLLIYNTLAAAGFRAPSTRPIVFEPSRTEVMRLTADGNVGVRTTAPNAPFEVAGRVSATVLQLGESNDGCTTATLGTIRRNPATGRFQICRM